MASDFKTALDAAMVELETGPTTTKAVAVSAPAVTVEQRGEEKKEEEEVAVVEDLFKAADFFPAEDVKQEVELSFEGQGLKLNTEEDAKGRKQVWDKEAFPIRLNYNADLDSGASQAPSGSGFKSRG